MEKIRLLKSPCVQTLKGKITENLERYRSGNFVDLLDEISIDIEVDYSKLSKLKMRDGDDLKDVENCVLVHEALSNLSPFAARDERLWTQLSHGLLLEYSRKRWPIPDNEEKAVASIRSHFFAGDKRKLEARNAVSRLWWLANIASRVTELDLRETLSLILHKQDVRQNVIERPTVLQAETILISVIKNLKKSKEADEKLYDRQVFRSLQERINEYCGYIFVESLPQKTVQIIVDEIIADILYEMPKVA